MVYSENVDYWLLVTGICGTFKIFLHCYNLIDCLHCDYLFSIVGRAT